VDVGPSPVVLNHQQIGHCPSGKDNGQFQYCLIIDVDADIDAVILAIIIFIVVVVVIVVEQRRVRRLAFALSDVLRHPVVDVVVVVVAPFSQNAVPAAATRGAAAAISSVADGWIDVDDPEAATRSDDAASSMQEKGNRNKNGTEDIRIQAFDAILQLGVGYWLIA
jgi:hypothetical protein